MACRCPLCGRYFMDYADLEDHLLETHDLTLHEAARLIPPGLED